MVENKLYPLTHPQQRIWYTEKLHPGTSMWNNAGTLKITGKLDLALMTKSINLFLKNNEAMRIRITEVDGQPFQYVSPFVYRSFDYLDFSGKGLQGLYEWDSAQTQAYLPFLDKPLFYIAIVRLGENEFVWYAKVHHIISDAWSLVMFSNQVMEHYDCYLSGMEPDAAQGGSYTRFIEREQEYLKSRRFEQDRQNFTQMFEDIPEPTVLKQKKTNYTGTRARRKAGIIPKSVADQMRIYCSEKNVSIFPLFLAALCIYINRILNKDDIVIGVPVFNRTKEERNTVGMFVTTVPIRIRMRDDLSFNEFVRAVSGEWFRVLKHQKYPYELLLADLRKKHKGLESLYDVTLSYQNMQFEKDTKNITYEGRWHFSGSQVHSLSIHINDREGEGSLILDYDHLIPLFSIKEIEYIHSHCVTILTDAIAHPEKKLYELDVMSTEELGRVMEEFNAKTANYPLDRGLDSLFMQQMKKTPEEIALVAGTDVLTYRQLNHLVNKAARRLKDAGVGREDIVGIVIEREYELIVFILAVLRAGAAFLPIDPDFPSERVVYELKESHAKCAVASPDFVLKCGGVCEVISTQTLGSLPEYEEEIKSNDHMNDLAYVIYTSGSTGNPKGVMVEQLSLVHYILAVSDIMDFTAGSVVLSATTVSFDIFIMETFPTLMNGGTVVLAGENEHNIPRNLVELMVRTRVTSILTTPSRMQLILMDKGADECLKNIKEIMLGGDVLQKTLLAELQEKTPAKILHFYGPTEITIGATYKDVTESATVNIGKPLPDTYAYILDRHKNPVPIGVHGELYIGGIGVSRGYLNRPELTAATFLDDPFNKGGRMYKTGDITRWFPMGEIEFLGRMDQQVKIRGFRIELGEIQTRLLKINGITDCAVVDRTDENDRKYLCAYICGDRSKSIARIKTKLARELPSYMVPSYFVWMDMLPLSVSGKVDKSKLPEPVMDDIHSGRDHFEPLLTSTQKALAEIWKDVLKVPQISGTDNFFDIGGDSLLIVMVSAEVYKRFTVEVSLEDVYKEPTLENYARLIDAEMQKTDSRPILPVRGRRDYPVSAAQRQIFIVSGGLLAQTTAYNIAGAYSIKGHLDISAMQRAFTRMIARNDSLRTGFEIKKGELRQKIFKQAAFELEVRDADKKEVAKHLNELIRPFDLSAPPLFRATLLKTGMDEYVLFLDLHHIIADGTSGEIILSQLSRLYAGKSISKNEITYKDYSVWQEDYLASKQASDQKKFWEKTLGGDLPSLNLNTDYKRDAHQNMEGNRFKFTIPKETTLKLRTLAQRSGSTMFMLLLSMYTVFLSKYAGQKDIVVGIPASVRNRHELMDIVGMFVNTLPIRTQLDSEETFLGLLERVRETCAAAFQNQTYPFESMVKDLRLTKESGRNPVFGTMLSYNTFDISSVELRDLKTKVTPVNPKMAKFDITLEIYDKSTTLACDFEYAVKLFKKESIQAMAQHFKTLVEEVLRDPQIKIGKIDILTPLEKRKILIEFNDTAYEYDEELPPIRLFERAAHRHPDKAAVVHNGRKMTYGEVNRAAESFAKLLADRGIARGDVVGICIDRSFDLVCAILGTMKTGAAYMPVDPFYPEDRKTFMLKDSGASVLVTDQPGKYDFAGETLLVQEIGKGEPGVLPKPDNKPDDVAVVIYTSGSTGRPKGAMLTVKGILNFVQVLKKESFYQEDTTVASVSSVSFDMFLSDSVVSLFFGATVLLMSEDECRQPHLLAPVIQKEGATFLQTTPSRMQILMHSRDFRDALKGIRLIVLGGEPVPPAFLKKIKNNTRSRILNVYGPTETTVYSSIKDLTHTSKINIGRPVLNMQYYILDADMRPVPIGCPGELYISGKGVSAGYVNREKLTRERYLNNPFARGVMYKTGDICTFLPNGETAYLGRVDFQVKLRGQRIELGEVESAILDSEGIESVAVMALGKEKEKYLCAYYTAKRKISEDALRASLSKKLPVYMIPSYFVALKRFPMTPGGKLDRNALPNPGKAARTQKAPAAKRAGMTDTQKKMAKVWKRILKVAQVRAEDNFFYLGGDSLAVIQVQTAILKYGFEIGTQDFYELKTLKAICDRIDHKIDCKMRPVTEAERFALDQKGVPVSLAGGTLKPAKLDCVLLTGSNGFLGAHLLRELANLYKSRVYCIMRANIGEDPAEKLRVSLTHYFGEAEAEKLFQNVRVLRGDITKEAFGLAAGERTGIAREVQTVIHCAALTSHYGMSEAFERTNVIGTEVVTAFCLKEKKQLLHVSTMSVAGLRVSGDVQKTYTFDETNYFIGQEYTDNEYRKSKFLAEGIILKAREQGLKARIYRAGNLTARADDGKYQMKPENNAFANRMKSIFKVGVLPENIRKLPVEMTPVDLCAKAMLMLSQDNEAHIAVYHLYNHNRITIEEVVEHVREILPEPSFVEPKVFEETVRSISMEKQSERLAGIINDLGWKETTEQNIESKSELTMQALHRLGFDWPQVSKEYTKRFFATICEP